MGDHRSIRQRFADIQARTDIDAEAKVALMSDEMARDQRFYFAARDRWISAAYLSRWMGPLIDEMHRMSIEEPGTPPVSSQWLGQRVLEALFVELHGSREEQDELRDIWRSMGITT